MTASDNVRFNKKLKGEPYQEYNNYEAIEIPFTDAIPDDYPGLMGVPISFLDKYNPDQFEILGITKTWDDPSGLKTRVYPTQTQVSKNGAESKVGKLNDGAAIKVSTRPTTGTYYKVGDDLFIQTYARILIRHKEAAS